MTKTPNRICCVSFKNVRWITEQPKSDSNKIHILHTHTRQIWSWFESTWYFFSQTNVMFIAINGRKHTTNWLSLFILTSSQQLDFRNCDLHLYIIQRVRAHWTFGFCYKHIEKKNVDNFHQSDNGKYIINSIRIKAI